MPITDRQAANLTAALSVARSRDEAERIAFGVWSESAALIQANDGTNQSDSPGFDTHPEWPGILRRSLLIRHDKVGNNGRSTGLLQQISSDVGGGWGDMAGTMDPVISAIRFRDRLVVTDRTSYAGWNVTEAGVREWVVVTGLDPVAVDVLYVQQPLASEARSANYRAGPVAYARSLADQFYRPTAVTPPRSSWWENLMNWSST